MRTIQKREPKALVEWRLKYRDDPNFGYALLRQDKAVIEAVVAALIEEQGGLCAYTGREITADGCHVEHMRPQTHCGPGDDVDYANLVACYPAPNRGREPYGAHHKDHWPSKEEEPLFVKPTSPSCEARFGFDRRGRIRSNEGDRPAHTTIEALRLDHPELTRKRKGAIESVIVPKRGVRLGKAQLKRVLRRLEGETGRLSPYVFAVKQGIADYMRKLP